MLGRHRGCARVTTSDAAWGAVIAFAGKTAPLAVAARRVNDLAAATDVAREALVEAMRADGWSWQEVGDALGVTHQAARNRFKARGIS